MALSLLLAASCGSEDERGAGFPGGGGAGGSVAGGGLAGLGVGGSPAGGRPSGTGGPDDTCEVQTVGTGRLAPDILIVLDRSLSMKPDDGSVNRWDPSVSAVKAITSQLQARVAFGLMTFSGGGGGGRGGGGNLSCAAGSVNVDVAQNTANEIAQALDGIQPAGATPTAVTMEAANDYMTNLQGGPDDRPSPKFVLLVTDGAPNCTNGQPPQGGNMSATGSQEAAQVDATVSVIEEMASRGFRTYVLGYDTQNDATLRDALDRMARAGGTGDRAHRPVGDEASLVSTFQSITGNVLSCEFVLEEAVLDKSYVKVLFDGKQLNVDDANGWVLNGDKRTVTLQGRACASAKQEGHTISVSVQCVPVGPLF
jgi:von Willebrand factor type A domain